LIILVIVLYIVNTQNQFNV